MLFRSVTFAGGNAGLCVFYMVGTFIACLLSVIACFCKQTKTGEAKATGKQFAAAGAVVVAALFLNILVIYVVIRNVHILERALGKTGVYVLRKFFGIILLALSVRMFLQNLSIALESF